MPNDVHGEECKHLLPAGQCSLCRPPPPGVLELCGHRRRPIWLVRHGNAAQTSAAASAGEKECLVQADGEWWPGVLTWEPAKRSDGLWWATVRYRKAGVLRTEVRCQHDLRAR